jgi:hypothetical protein
MIFFIRFITATCLFAFLGKANVWLNPLSNVLLAIGYRFFLILSPLFSRVSGKYAVTVALFISAAGTLLFCLHHDYWLAAGAILVGIGLSVSGYLIKSEAAETPAGAAHNKIALNAGSLLSGVVLLITLESKNIFFGISAAILFILAIISFASSRKKKDIALPIPKTLNKKKWVGWLLVGIAVGIKLFGVLSVLPQYILANTTKLPYWYGVIVFVNSAVIILCQLPIIHWIEKFKANNNAFKITLGIMIIGMLLIAFPNLFYAYTLIGALIWTLLLSLIECCASYLDVQGSRAGFLIVKETAVGLGAGLTVFFSRYFPSHLSSLVIGASGIIAIIIATCLLYEDLKTA